MWKRVLGFILWFAICGAMIGLGFYWKNSIPIGLGIGSALFGIYGVIMTLAGRVEIRSDETLRAILVVVTLYLEKWYDWLVLVLCLGGAIGLAVGVQLGK